MMFWIRKYKQPLALALIVVAIIWQVFRLVTIG
jgi:hypothetical protein